MDPVNFIYGYGKGHALVSRGAYVDSPAVIISVFDPSGHGHATTAIAPRNIPKLIAALQAAMEEDS